MPHRGGAGGIRAARLPPEPGRDDGARSGQLCPAHPSDQHRAPRVFTGEPGERSVARGAEVGAAGGRDGSEGKKRAG